MPSYRETEGQLHSWANRYILAVEMQAASLLAFGAAHSAAVACVAMVSNAVGHDGQQFDTGSQLRLGTACPPLAMA
jgi:uridine phosphorylase